MHALSEGMAGLSTADGTQAKLKAKRRASKVSPVAKSVDPVR
jgi:hypothetical protein